MNTYQMSVFLQTFMNHCGITNKWFALVLE